MILIVRGISRFHIPLNQQYDCRSLLSAEQVFIESADLSFVRGRSQLYSSMGVVTPSIHMRENSQKLFF